MPEDNLREHRLNTNFFTHQAEATHTPLYKQTPIMIVLVVVGIGILFGLFKFVDFLLNFDKLNAMKAMQVNLRHPTEKAGMAFIDVEVQNYNPAPIRNLVIKYNVVDKAGNITKNSEFTLPGTVPAGDSRVFPHVALGTLSAGRMQSEIADLRYGPKPTLSPELTAKFIELSASDPKASLASWTAFVKASPEFPTGYIRLGHSLAANKQLDNAIKAYEKALKMDPDDANAHYCLGVAHFYKSENALAKQEFEAAAKLDPEDPAAKESVKRLEAMTP